VLASSDVVVAVGVSMMGVLSVRFLLGRVVVIVVVVVVVVVLAHREVSA
jgi:hypothetical protein